MAYDHTIDCPTPRCAEAIAKYGDHYRAVSVTDECTLCERCGGIRQEDGTWLH